MTAQGIRTTRAAMRADYDAFARLFAELGPDDPVPDASDFSERMLPRVQVATHAGSVVGYAYWRRAEQSAHVSHLVVQQNMRGQGMGRVLMAAIRRSVVAEGCRNWDLNVKSDNVSAMRLYRACGLLPNGHSTVMRMMWARASELPSASAPLSLLHVGTEDDGVIEAQFGVARAHLAFLRTRPERLLLALASKGKICAFAAFDPIVDRANPLCVARVEYLRPFLDVLVARARPKNDGGSVELVVSDRAAAVTLQQSGATIRHELIHMVGNLQ